jgi:amidohydrolase
MTEVDTLKERARRSIEAVADTLIGLSHRIQANPELAFQEHKASAWVTETLAENGFTVERGVADLPTAIVATAGTGALTIGLCAEYDALPEVGHACGHNVIAAASVGAGIALARLTDDLGVTVRVLGTPAEEKGGGKILMLERGAFEGVHAAMLIHPGPFAQDEVTCSAIACSELDVEYTGKAAHAAGYPWLGLNAADAATVAQVGIGLLRQHLQPGDRIHGIVTHGGGAPNVIPERTTMSYLVRARTLPRLTELERRVVACLEAGAQATGCEIAITRPSPTYSHFEGDRDLESLYTRNLIALGTEPGPPDEALYSTDMSNVSMALPAIHPTVGIESGTAVNHQAEFAAHCVEPSADQAILRGATAMACTCIDAATNEELRARLLAGRRNPGTGPGA